MTESEEHPRAQQAAVTGLWAAGFQTIGQMAAQTTAVIGVLYYFGWARTNAIYSYFGVSPSIIGFSTTDYALRSVSVIVRPAVIAGLLALGLTAIHRALSYWLNGHISAGRKHVPRVIGAVLAALGVVLCVAGLLGFYDLVIYSIQYPVVPVLLAASVVLVVYAAHIIDSTLDDRQPDDQATVTRPFAMRDMSSAGTAVLLIIAAALALWTVAVYAGLDGQRSARELLAGLPGRTAVVVYSEKDLNLLDNRGSPHIDPLNTPDGQYKFRYTGLRLLVYSQGRYVLLPDNWAQRGDPVYILDESPDLRFELT